jgi:hypothetical protein
MFSQTYQKYIFEFCCQIVLEKKSLEHKEQPKTMRGELSS